MLVVQKLIQWFDTNYATYARQESKMIQGANQINKHQHEEYSKFGGCRWGDFPDQQLRDR